MEIPFCEMWLIPFFLILQEFEADKGSEALIEELQRLESQPIAINTASKCDLLKLYWISPQLAESIINYRKEIDGFKRIDDLKKVPGISDEIFENIHPYITVNESSVARRLKTSTISRPLPVSIEFRTRFQERVPDAGGNLDGDPRKMYEKLKLNYKKTSCFVLLEKDSYEVCYSDFVAYGLTISDWLCFKKVVLGDYRLEFGERLLFGFPPMITFKSSGIVRSRERGIYSYTITGENNFLRGVALESSARLKPRFYIFFSDTKLDGKFEDSVVYIYYNYTGDHSTLSGRLKKDKIRELLFGSRVELADFGSKIGLTWYRSSHFLNPEAIKIGSHLLFGLDGSTRIFGVEYFGELGKATNGMAWVIGTQYEKGGLSFRALSRYYPTNFFIFHASPFSDKVVETYGVTEGLGERGNYLYGAYRVSKNTKLLVYTDIFSHLQSSSLPIIGNEYFSELHHKLMPQMRLTLRYKFKHKGSAECRWFRLQSDIETNDIWLRLRAEKAYETGVLCGSGELLYGDFGFKGFKNLTFSLRLILFDSGLHKFRLYEYERDLPGVMTNQGVGGNGSRIYLLLKESINQAITISIKYGLTVRNDDSMNQKYGLQFDLEI